jgi:hypothetical protein
MDEQDLASSLLSLGYKDYIASRFLLNNNYLIQGLTLASSAVEKYFKVILALNGKTKKEMGVHLDRLDKLKKLLSDCYTDITVHLDERFLQLLGKAYQARYYDNLSQPITISFFVNQVLGELDFTINFIESLVTKKNTSGELFKTSYRRAVEENNADLYYKNYVLQRIPKKEFMEAVDNGFAVYIDCNNTMKEIEVEGTNIRNTYDGNIGEINIEFK